MPCCQVNLRFFLWIALALSIHCGCVSVKRSEEAHWAGKTRHPLTMMSLGDGPSDEFERNTLTSFVDKLGYRFLYLPAFESMSDRINSYQQLFRERSPQPDLLEIDIIWPAIFANDLVDLKPYLGHDTESFPSEVLNAYTVNGRLLAVPVYIDTGLLYYRSDLLKKYRFAKPPETWDELEHMANVIQRGERSEGKKNFWGFVWQGDPSEALTCDAFEWFSSQGAGQILEADRTIRVYNRNALRALERAVSWIGTITPSGVIGYTEDDSANVWGSGHAAFLRSWASMYSSTLQSNSLQGHFGVGIVPGGSSSSKVRTLGGAGIAVSRYSEHREEAIAALRYLISSPVQAERAKQLGSVPTRQELQSRADIMMNTPFRGLMAGQTMTGVLARPSTLAGKSYDQVSHAYFEAVHSVLTRQSAPADALAKLERQLVAITGFRAVRD
jgi:trehalose/maltose transport system substrate-binding protein